MKKGTRKSKGAKSVKSLPAKKLSGKTAKDVKGGVHGGWDLIGNRKY
jgi:hypothetical protein